MNNLLRVVEKPWQEARKCGTIDHNEKGRCRKQGGDVDGAAGKRREKRNPKGVLAAV